jgi:hypothetical protein
MLKNEMKENIRLCSRIFIVIFALISFRFIYLYFLVRRSRNRAVGITTGYGLDDRGVAVRVPVVSSKPALGPTQPSTQWVSNGDFSPSVKLPGREADHSPPASAEIKKTWLYTSTSPYVFMT